jgi:hypothetical protein
MWGTVLFCGTVKMAAGCRIDGEDSKCQLGRIPVLEAESLVLGCALWIARVGDLLLRSSAKKDLLYVVVVPAYRISGEPVVRTSNKVEFALKHKVIEALVYLKAR